MRELWGDLFGSERRVSVGKVGTLYGVKGSQTLWKCRPDFLDVLSSKELFVQIGKTNPLDRPVSFG